MHAYVSSQSDKFQISELLMADVEVNGVLEVLSFHWQLEVVEGTVHEVGMGLISRINDFRLTLIFGNLKKC